MMKKNIGSLIGGVGGFLLFISSFMPWLDVDMILARGQYSAWEIIRLAETFGFNNLSFLYLIPVLGLGACGLALWNVLQPPDAAGSKNRAIGSLAAGGVALLTLLIFAGGVANANAQVSDISSGLVNKLIRAGFGTTLAWLSTVAIGVGALMNMGVIDVGSGDSLPSRPAAPRPVMPQPVRPPALSPSSFMPPPAVAINSAGPSLFALSGPNAGQTFTLRDKQVIGRSSQCEIQLKDMTVSRKHAMLREASGGWFIQDQESTGGILVNGQKVPAVQLKSGDRIQIGESVLQFRS